MDGELTKLVGADAGGILHTGSAAVTIWTTRSFKMQLKRRLAKLASQLGGLLATLEAAGDNQPGDHCGGEDPRPAGSANLSYGHYLAALHRSMFARLWAPDWCRRTSVNRSWVSKHGVGGDHHHGLRASTVGTYVLDQIGFWDGRLSRIHTAVSRLATTKTGVNGAMQGRFGRSIWAAKGARPQSMEFFLRDTAGFTCPMAMLQAQLHQCLQKRNHGAEFQDWNICA